MEKRILILAANPKNTSPLRLDQEIREIENGLQRSSKRDSFLLKYQLASRPIDVRRAMLDFKPNIVHFCGHGAGENGLALEDETGNVQLVGAIPLSDFFDLFKSDVECVLLNACYSEIQALAIAKHIKNVIGMDNSISDTAAIEFSVAFYDALGAEQTIEFAYRLACNAIQWGNNLESKKPILHSWSRPESLSLSKEKRVKILLVDEDNIARLGVKALLFGHPLFEVIGEAGTAIDCLQLVKDLSPDIAIIDIRLEGNAGIITCNKIKRSFPKTEVVVLTYYPDDELLFSAIVAGASAYVLKRGSGDDLIQALERIALGETLLDRETANKVLQMAQSQKELLGPFQDLSQQEKHILLLVSEGKTNSEIAKSLFLGKTTVQNYINLIVSKLGLTNRAEAAAYAVEFDLARRIAA